MKPEIWIVIAGVTGALAVALGAYGVHGFQGTEFYRKIFLIGVDYQLWHSLALLGAALLAIVRPRTSGIAQAAALMFVVGMVCFSGALYVMAMSGGATIITGVAPFGGTAFMVGWLTLAVAAWRGRTRDDAPRDPDGSNIS